MTPIAIALGSNVGDREQYLKDAVASLAPFISNVHLSRFFETEPIDMPGPQRSVINAAATGQTALPARALLAQMLETEQQPGRTRPPPAAARPGNLVLIPYGNEVIDEPP